MALSPQLPLGARKPSPLLISIPEEIPSQQLLMTIPFIRAALLMVSLNPPPKSCCREIHLLVCEAWCCCASPTAARATAARGAISARCPEDAVTMQTWTPPPWAAPEGQQGQRRLTRPVTRVWMYFP